MSMPDWVNEPVAVPDEQIFVAAQAHQNTLTKPPGSLGLLENIAVHYCAWQKSVAPQINTIVVRIFAGDHGVCQQGVSAFPQVVTTQMIQNFVSGGAAISVLSRDIGADFAVVNLGTAHPLIDERGVEQHVIAPGTQDFTETAAMTAEQCAKAMSVGKKIVDSQEMDLFIGGEMGIANTTSASAIMAVLLERDPRDMAGPGTGVKQEVVKLKGQVIVQGIARHKKSLTTPFGILSSLGGFEIAALTGAYIRCAQRGVPVLVDGFICTAAALLACKVSPKVLDWLLFSHSSAEPGHKLALEHLGKRPLLDLGMRLGEGSGAAVAVPLIQSALSLHNNMSTFSQAGVSTT